MFNNDRPDFEAKWDDIGTFIQYGILTDDKFAEKASAFTIYKNTKGEYRNLAELKEKIEVTQKDKDNNIVVLYTQNPEEQHSFINTAENAGYEVLVMEGPLTSHFISHVESKNQDIRFKRVDADVLDKLIQKSDSLPIKLTEDEKNTLRPILEEVVDAKKYMIQFEGLSSDEPPFIVTQNEFMRRMKEQSAMGGGGFYGTLPESYNLVVNGNHPFFEKVIQDKEANKEQLKQAIDLALLAKGLLKGEDLTNFIQRSFKSI
jgi:molecular chaperone HtpG